MLQVRVRTEIILCFWSARGCLGVLRRRRVEEKGLTVFVGHIGDSSSVRCDKAAERLCIIDALLSGGESQELAKESWSRGLLLLGNGRPDGK
jgi:hypothetical protein